MLSIQGDSCYQGILEYTGAVDSLGFFLLLESKASFPLLQLSVSTKKIISGSARSTFKSQTKQQRRDAAGIKQYFLGNMVDQVSWIEMQIHQRINVTRHMQKVVAESDCRKWCGCIVHVRRHKPLIAPFPFSHCRGNIWHLLERHGWATP